MKTSTIAIVASSLLLSGCATLGGGSAMDDPGIPADAVSSVHTEANGDQIEEYRVAGQLRMVKVTPARGPVYYLYDQNGDGQVDRTKGGVSPVYYKLFSF